MLAGCPCAMEMRMLTTCSEPIIDVWRLARRTSSRRRLASTRPPSTFAPPWRQRASRAILEAHVLSVEVLFGPHWGSQWVQCCRVTCGRALSYLQTSRAEEPHQLLLQGQHCGVSVCYPSVPLAGAVCGRVPVRVIGRLWPTPVHVKPFTACRSHQYRYIGQLEHLEERVLSYYM